MALSEVLKTTLELIVWEEAIRGITPGSVSVCVPDTSGTNLCVRRQFIVKANCRNLPLEPPYHTPPIVDYLYSSDENINFFYAYCMEIKDLINGDSYSASNILQNAIWKLCKVLMHWSFSG